MNSYAKIWDYNVICQVCRAKIKASTALKRWDGLIVCKDDYETRHPLDMPAPKQPEERTLPFTSPESEDTLITVTLDAGVDTTGVPSGNFDTNNRTL